VQVIISKYQDNLSTYVVGCEGDGWNPLLSSLINLAKELEKLGLVYADGAVS